MKSTFSRWLPAIAREHDSKIPFSRKNLNSWLPDVSGRKAVLGIAGLAFVGAGIGAPATVAATGSNAGTAPTAAHASVAPSSDPSDATMVPVAFTKGAPTAKALKYDYKRQPNFYYCGPTATRIALTAIGHAPSFDDVAKKLGTTENGTNSAKDTTRVLNSVSGTHQYKTHEISGKSATKKQTEQLSEDVVNAVTDNRAVVANIAGTVTDTGGNVHSYEGGHYLTIVGYANEGKTVKIADPADDKGNGSYWLPVDSMANWIATRGYSA